MQVRDSQNLIFHAVFITPANVSVRLGLFHIDTYKVNTLSLVVLFHQEKNYARMPVVDNLQTLLYNIGPKRNRH